jgi:hypothetical protein
MDWQNILKGVIKREDVIKAAKEAIEGEHREWEVTHFSYLYSSLGRGMVSLRVKKRDGGSDIACLVESEDIRLDSILDKVKGEFGRSENLDAYKKRVVESVKPTFRSLNWFYEVIEPIDEIIDIGAGFEIIGDSTNQYTILSSSLKSSGCYEVRTYEGYSICIEIDERKPAGDNLLGLALGLLNDESTSESVEGLTDYMSDWQELQCQVCGHFNEFSISDEGYQCENCTATTQLTDIRFEPRFQADEEVQDEEGPNGVFNPHFRHVVGDMFLQENKLFRLKFPNEYDLTVRGDPESILEDTDNDKIFISNNMLYDEDGDEMGLYEVREILSEDVDFIKFIVKYLEEDMYEVYDYLEYVNLGGDLWSDRKGGYLGDDGNFTDNIEEIYNLSEMSEEEFIMNAIEEWELPEDNVLGLFDYKKDGEYWIKWNGKKYELVNGEMVEQDEGGITKNLSSKSVLPINMKWTDYLRKTSNTKSEDWESALKSFISDGKKLGIPLSVMELLKLAKEATTSQSEGFETLHRPTFSEEEEEDV